MSTHIYYNSDDDADDAAPRTRRIIGQRLIFEADKVPHPTLLFYSILYITLLFILLYFTLLYLILLGDRTTDQQSSTGPVDSPGLHRGFLLGGILG
jgi:hypothetical protein